MADWKSARRILQDVPALAELFREVRLIRLFRATDALATGLGERWLTSSSYGGVSDLIKRILEQERLIAVERDPQGCILMNIHESKGKEFDGVALVEGAFKSGFFNERSETPPFESSPQTSRGRADPCEDAGNDRPQNARPRVD